MNPEADRRSVVRAATAPPAPTTSRPAGATASRPRSRQDTAGVGAPTRREQILGAAARLFAERGFHGVGVDEIGVTDTLFALGGDSVLATTIVARIRAAFDITSVTVRMLFTAPTVSGLAESMIAAEGDAELLEATAEIYVSIESMSEDQLLAELDHQHTS